MSSDLMVLGGDFLATLQGQAQCIEPSGDAARVRFIDTDTFLGLDCSQEWLIEDILVARQPGVVGGPKKALKTSLLVDAAVSLATGRPFLGRFRVPFRRRVGMISGESGEATLRNTFLRVCEAKGVDDPGSVPIHWAFELPRLTSQADMAALSEQIVEYELGVVLLDPLYLCLLAGGAGVNPANLFEVGPLLAGVSRVCLDAGATPILAHHNHRHVAQPLAPAELEDLAFSGIQEFARQWLLVSRREKYEPGTGEHRLWMTVGGSAGFSGCWALDVSEGALDRDFGGRRWDVSVVSVTDHRRHEAAGRERAREEMQEQQLNQDCGTLREFLRRHAHGETLTQIRDLAGVPRSRLGRALERLLARREVEECMVRKPAGRAGTTEWPGYRLVLDLPPPVPATHERSVGETASESPDSEPLESDENSATETAETEAETDDEEP